jgi:hypothetical protein
VLRIKHKTRRRKGGTYPLSHLYGYFGLVRNTTGFALPEYGVGGKWLELLKEVAPRVTRVAVIRDASVTAGIGGLAAIQTESNKGPITCMDRHGQLKKPTMSSTRALALPTEGRPSESSLHRLQNQ